MTFKQMNISEPVCRALLEKDYSTPTLIQEQAIPEALTGRDLLGLAQTGTGQNRRFRRTHHRSNCLPLLCPNAKVPRVASVRLS